jgi:4-amino-4-deoxy-L-arabinose transferase-like glycosyltransferase
MQSLRWAVWLLAAVVCARMASLAFYPLTDLTEGRYSNIARVMLESGDWITPQTAPGAPFWAKPPLFAWASAASMGLMGINELGARLPSLAFAVMTLIVVYFWGLDLATRSGIERPRDAAVAAVLVASTCLGLTASPVRRAVLHGVGAAAAVASVALAGSLVVTSGSLADNYSTREVFHAWEAARVAVPGRLIFEQQRVASSLLFYASGAVLGETEEVDESATHYDIYTREQADHFAGQPPECVNARVIVERAGDYVLVRETSLPEYCDVE